MRLKYRKVGEREAVHPRRNGQRVMLRTYQVIVDDVPVGIVRQVQTTSYRKHGRIRFNTGHPILWGWMRYSDHRTNPPGLYKTTRKAAALEMMGLKGGAA